MRRNTNPGSTEEGESEDAVVVGEGESGGDLSDEEFVIVRPTCCEQFEAKVVAAFRWSPVVRLIMCAVFYAALVVHNRRHPNQESFTTSLSTEFARNHLLLFEQYQKHVEPDFVIYPWWPTAEHMLAVQARLDKFYEYFPALNEESKTKLHHTLFDKMLKHLPPIRALGLHINVLMANLRDFALAIHENMENNRIAMKEIESVAAENKEFLERNVQDLAKLKEEAQRNKDDAETKAARMLEIKEELTKEADFRAHESVIRQVLGV